MDEDRSTQATPPPATPGGPTPPRGLVERVKNILISPKSEWGVIEREASSVQGIYTNYILILAAIGPVALLIGQQLIGQSMGGFTFRPSIGFSLTSAILGYALTLAAVYVAALVIDALAPTFKGEKNFLNAFKIAAYSWTPGWLAAVLGIIPQLVVIGLLGALYGFYLLYLGLPRLMKVKEDQAIGYVGVVIFVQFVILAIVFVAVGQITAALFAPTVAITPGTITYG